VVPTNIGRLGGLTQAPIRRLFQMFPAARRGAKKSGRTPTAGTLGRLLYSSRRYDVTNARRALAASLRNLRRERIDYFMLHEPCGAIPDDYRYLVDYLDGERLKGVIRYWGPAGDLSQMDANTRALTDRACALQFPYNLITGSAGPDGDTGRPTTTFGFISDVLPRVRCALTEDAELARQCSELLDADLRDDRTVVRLLVRNAVTHNKFGTVLLSSTSKSHLETVWEAAGAPMQNEEAVAGMIQQKCMGCRA
jgi:D-threo-aldose 1-dehydrogenase